MQMRHQSYPTRHVIYVNSPEPGGEDINRDYERILGDLIATSSNLEISYGPTRSPHQNYLTPLQNQPLDDYDLFLKIDDDDIYFSNYVAEVVKDFVALRWDYSGSHAEGYLKGPHLIAQELSGLGLSEEDLKLAIPEMMPPTIALSRKAVRAIFDVDDTGEWEDFLWRQHLAKVSGIKMAVRRKSNFVYNIHGGNVSTASFF